MAEILRGFAIGGAALAALALLPAQADAAGGTAECAALAKSAGSAGVTISASRWIAAAGGLPAFCEVQATLNPAPGSAIGVVYRLPQDWNGKILGIGGGGWAGNVTLQAGSDGLKRHYATAQTDGGHPGTSPWDNAWVSNPAAVTDFAYRAIHLMTVTGKAVVAHYYGRPHAYAYYQGCSTGGRMGLMEAQRFPDDYDGIIAGAPVYSLQVQTSSILRNQTFGAPGAALGEDQLRLVNDASVKACDAADGLKDGLIGNPRACDGISEARLERVGDDRIAHCGLRSVGRADRLRLDQRGAGNRAGQRNDDAGAGPGRPDDRVTATVAKSCIGSTGRARSGQRARGDGQRGIRRGALRRAGKDCEHGDRPARNQRRHRRVDQRRIDRGIIASVAIGIDRQPAQRDCRGRQPRFEDEGFGAVVGIGQHERDDRRRRGRRRNDDRPLPFADEPGVEPLGDDQRDRVRRDGARRALQIVAEIGGVEDRRARQRLRTDYSRANGKGEDARCHDDRDRRGDVGACSTCCVTDLQDDV